MSDIMGGCYAGVQSAGRMFFAGVYRRPQHGRIGMKLVLRLTHSQIFSTATLNVAVFAICFLSGCSFFQPDYAAQEAEATAKRAEEQSTALEKQQRQLEEQYNPPKPEEDKKGGLLDRFFKKKPDTSSDTQNNGRKQDQDVTININNAGMTGGSSPAFWRKPAPAVQVPAPELENVNRYAQALQEKLLRRYNNTPPYAGNVAKVQLLPTQDPEVSMDGRKLRMEWSQVVFDSWGKRIPDLEKEYYIVTFGDGKPLMQRTRPTITVGLNNESGYSEFSRVRGGILSKVEAKGDPGLFDKPDSEKTGPLEEGVKAKDSAPAPYLEYDLPEIGSAKSIRTPKAPVIQPAPAQLQALMVLERME